MTETEVEVDTSVSSLDPSEFKRQKVLNLLKNLDDSVIRLDLGGGHAPQQGCVVMDIQELPGVDVVHDWDDIPWPFPDNCATIVIAGHVVEHVDPAKFGFIKWMNEVWRVTKAGGQLLVTCPYAGSPGYYADPTHVNPCTHHTWRYFDPLATPLGSPNLWAIYKPKPWKIKNCYWQVDGNMEVLMEKCKLDGEVLISERNAKVEAKQKKLLKSSKKGR